MVTLGDKKICPKYSCELCNYNTSKKSSYNNHINSKKHIMVTNDDKICQNYAKNMPNTSITNTHLTCECGKTYKHRQGLWRHKQICYNVKQAKHTHTTNTFSEHNTCITPDLVLELMKNNEEFKNIIVEQNNTINNLVKNGITNNYITNNNNHSNSHNKTFNLQVFLNETCKDAMNINDFVDSIKLQLSDFERMGEVGYAQGISDIITSNLQALDITQRPVHCTDKKRETMYVKDQDQWMKEDENKSKIKKMIKRIENKNIQIIPQFQKKYPNYANPKSHESDKYHKTIIEVMGGPGGSEGKEGKIIRNISKVTTIREKE